MDPIRITVAGAAGRMGQTIVRSVLDDHECALAGAIEFPAHACLDADAGSVCGRDPAGVAITSDWVAALRNADALIDFTTPAASVDFAREAADACIVHVIGTTGFNKEQSAAINAASRRGVVIKSDNMSLGANLLAALVAQAAKVLRDFDVQIVEMHHRMKKDAPSGTALMLGRTAAEARGYLASDLADRAAKPEQASVGFASLRGGTVVGEHKVIFAGVHERLVLEHVAEDRSIFARGAIAAAKWGRGGKPGLYEMLDVLGLRQAPQTIQRL